MERQGERVIRRDFDLTFDGIGLKAYTETIDGVEVKFLGGTASSTAKDLYGDVIAPSGQVKMMEKLTKLAGELKEQKSGLTAWLNHSYKLPEDTLGAFTGASLTTRDDGGETFIDLDIKCRVTETNPRGLAAWQQVKDGIRHGWSIGAYFTEAEWMSDDPASPDYWSLYVTDLNLIEISLVGIPANQRAWCKSAADVKAKAAALAEAENIVRDAKDAAQKRSLVMKSLISLDDAPAHREATKTADSMSTSPITAREASWTDDDGKKLADAMAAISAMSDAELREVGRLEAVKTLKELQERVGDENGNATKLCLEVAIKALESRQLEAKEQSELSAALREAAGDDPTKIMLSQAADAIEALSALISARSYFAAKGNSTAEDDDDDDKIALAIGHLAKSVGHGLCVRGGGHIAKAIECLAAAVVDQPGPTGTEDTDTYAAQIKKLSPKGGDVIVVHTKDAPSQEFVDRLVKSGAIPERVHCMVLSADMSVNIDADFAAKSQSLTETTAALEAKTAELATLEASIAAKNAELTEATTKATEAATQLAELEAKIKEAGEKRLGRVGEKTFEDIARERAAEIKEPLNENDRVAILAAFLKQNGDAPPSGRDLVA